MLRPDGRIIAKYYYDAAGRLVSVEGVEGPTTDLIWDGDHIIAERPHNPRFGSGYNYVWGALQDQLVEIQDRGTSHESFPAKAIPLTDHRNSVVGLWSASEGELTDIIDYTSHGRLTVKDSREETVCDEPGTGRTCYVPDTPFLFGSMYRSRRTGLSYMRNRWYSARLKQFLSPDPAGYVDSYNPYAYVAFDPINGWDPYGLGSIDFYDGSPLGIVEWVYQMGRDDGEVEQTLDAAGDKVEGVAKEMKEDALERDSVLGGIEYSAGEVLETLAPTNAEQFMFDLSVGLGLSGVRIASKGVKAFDDLFSGSDDALRVGKICSFTAGTQVRMCDGSMRPIEEVEAGDRVLSRDAETGEVDCREVRNPYVEYKPVAEVTLESGDGTTEVIESTTSHPFRVRGEGWVKVGEMTPGSRVVGAGGEELLVSRIAFTTRSEAVYNFGVEEFRSYFVGESGAWVHNCLGGLKGSAPSWVSDILGSQKRGADDVLRKGVHFTVEGTEVAVRPTGKGEIALKKVFPSESDETFKKAAKKFREAMEYNKTRREIYDHAQTALEQARSRGRGEAFEFKELMKTLESMGD